MAVTDIAVVPVDTLVSRSMNLLTYNIGKACNSQLYINMLDGKC